MRQKLSSAFAVNVTRLRLRLRVKRSKAWQAPATKCAPAVEPVGPRCCLRDTTASERVARTQFASSSSQAAGSERHLDLSCAQVAAVAGEEQLVHLHEREQAPSCALAMQGAGKSDGDVAGGESVFLRAQATPQKLVRCRQHYRTRCRKCFPLQETAPGSKRVTRPVATKHAPHERDDGSLERWLGELGWLRPTRHRHDDLGMDEFGRQAFRLGKKLQQLLRERPEARTAIVHAVSEVLAQFMAGSVESGRHRVLFIAAWMMQSLVRDAPVTPSSTRPAFPSSMSASRDQFVWTDNTLRGILTAVDAVLCRDSMCPSSAHRWAFDDHPQLDTDVAQDVAPANIRQLHQSLASEVLHWRLLLAPEDDAANAKRFADPRILVNMIRQWQLQTLHPAAAEQAVVLMRACVSRRCWRAAVDLLQMLGRLGVLDGVVWEEERSRLFQELVAQQQWSLARECAESWNGLQGVDTLHFLRGRVVADPPCVSSAGRVADLRPLHGIALMDLDAIPTPALTAQRTGEPASQVTDSSPTTAAAMDSPPLSVLRLPPHVRIHMVDTPVAVHTLMQFVESILHQHSDSCTAETPWLDPHCVGLDVEWRPVRTSGLQPRCALLQIAFPADVFLVDLLRIDADALFAMRLNEALRRLFRSPAILKVGFCFSSDFVRLRHSYLGLSCFDAIVALRDLDRIGSEGTDAFCADLATLVGRTSVRRRGRLTVGLAQLVAVFLGRAFDKRPRCSDWEARPLTRAQIEYAALDAWVLLALRRHVPCASASLIRTGWRTAQAALARIERITVAAADASSTRGHVSGEDTSHALHYDALQRVCDALQRAPERWRRRPVYRVGETLLAGPFCLVDRLAALERAPASLQRAAADRMGKCIALIAGGAEQRPILVVMEGQRRAPLREIAERLGLGSGALRFATPFELETIFGFASGAVSAIGLRCERADGGHGSWTPVLTFMDAALRRGEVADGGKDAADDLMFLSGGSPESVVALRASDLHWHRQAVWLTTTATTTTTTSHPESNVRAVVSDTAALLTDKRRLRASATWTETYFDDRCRGYFVVDSTMGGLVRRLRALGLDVLHTCGKDLALLFELVWTREEDVRSPSASKPRVILTRDADVLARATRYGVPCYYVSSTKTESQAREVLGKFRLSPAPENFLARCIQCNCARFEQRSREEVQTLLPQRTVNSFHIFYECARCHQLYWKGAHFTRATRQLEELVRQLRCDAQQT